MTSDKSSGFFMDHSVPDYPLVNDKTRKIESAIDESQRHKAQHHLCLTIKDSKMTEEIYKQSCFIEPNVYETNDFFAECED